MDKLEKGPKEIFTPEIQKDLLLLEEQEGSVNFKFGVLYTKPGQLTDDEMFSNEEGSEEFNNFIGLLGEKIRLKGWDKYRGGLDVKGDMTGKYSVYTIYEGHEIMFHVSTLLPYSKDNRQQVERKRHIGNDIVNIVYLDGGAAHMHEFNPSFIKSQFTHVFALVAYQKEDESYRLIVFSEESVPLFGPSLPCPASFRSREEFREFLIVKLINGEKAAFNTPTFSKKRERTLDMLIKDLYSEHMADSGSRVKINPESALEDASSLTPEARSSKKFNSKSVLNHVPSTTRELRSSRSFKSNPNQTSFLRPEARFSQSLKGLPTLREAPSVVLAAALPRPRNRKYCSPKYIPYLSLKTKFSQTFDMKFASRHTRLLAVRERFSTLDRKAIREAPSATSEVDLSKDLESKSKTELAEESNPPEASSSPVLDCEPTAEQVPSLLPEAVTQNPKSTPIQDLPVIPEGSLPQTPTSQSATKLASSHSLKENLSITIDREDSSNATLTPS